MKKAGVSMEVDTPARNVAEPLSISDFVDLSIDAMEPGRSERELLSGADVFHEADPPSQM
jgi:hypothetical protein